MKRRRATRLLAQKKEPFSYRVLDNSEKTRRVDRSGKPSLLKDFLSPHLDSLSPFSSVGWYFQTPHAQSSAGLASLDIARSSFASRIEEHQKRQLYQLVFLGDDEDQSVEVKEVEEIDFAELKARLKQGESVFITRKESEKIELIDFDEE